MDLKTILFIGRPGSGKSTQAKLLADHFAELYGEPATLFLAWSTIRDAFIRSGSYGARRVQEFTDAGTLLPKFLSIALWSQALMNESLEGRNLILEGIPRQLFEAEAFDSLLHLHTCVTPVVVYMDIDRDAAHLRLLARAGTEQRADDSEAARIERRLDWFESDTMPVLEFFRSDPYYRVVDIDAAKSPDDVTKEIMSAIA